MSCLWKDFYGLLAGFDMLQVESIGQGGKPDQDRDYALRYFQNNHARQSEMYHTLTRQL